MTLTNGDATTGSSQLLPEQQVLDYSKALEVLQNECKIADGLDAKTLLDSRTNGGLTYNDFLVLPGYIGSAMPYTQALSLLTSHSRLRCIKCFLRHSSYQANLSQNAPSLVSYGHCH